MNKVMVLGAAGWLGMRLVERLVAQGRHVICVDVRIPETLRKLPHVDVVEADMRDTARIAQMMRGCETVFNCCGLQHPKSTHDIYVVNRDAPATIFTACMQEGVRTFVHISSIAAYGQNQNGMTFLDESSPLLPLTHYGKSKAQGDILLQNLAEEAGTRLIILRPGVFYGERPSKNLTEFLEKVQKSTMPLFSQQGFLRTSLDIDKAVDAMVLAETRGTSGEAYNIGDTQPLSTLQFYTVLADELGVPLKKLRVPLFTARAAEKVALLAGAKGIHLRIPTIIGEFGRHTFVTSKKAAAELGFVPHLSSEEGLRRMVRSTKAPTTKV